MNSQLAQVLQTLYNSKPNEIPTHYEHILPVLKEELTRLNAQIKLQNEKNKQGESGSEVQVAIRKGRLSVLFDQVYRIKRFLMIYHKFRCDRIEEQFWKFGGDLHHQEKHNLSEGEKNYFNAYKDIAVAYGEKVGMDLTLDLDPPLELQVQVRMLIDCGDIVNSQGQLIKLDKHSGMYISKQLIESYVKQGFARIKR